MSMKKKQTERILNNHPYSIYQDAKGRWYTYVEDSTRKNNRRLIAKSTKEKLEDALVKHYKEADEDYKLKRATLETLHPVWLEHKSMHTNAKTSITRLESDWKTYYLNSDIIKVPIISLTKLMLDEWVHTLIQTHHLTKKKYYNITLIIRQELAYAVDLGIIQSNPMDSVKVNGKRMFRPEKKKPNETQVYLESEFIQLKELAWEDYENKVKVYELSPLAVLFMFYTGVRISEVCTLRYEDILTSDSILICRMLRRDTKEIVDHPKGTYGHRTVFLPSEAKHLIQTAKERQQELGVDDNGYIFSINGQYVSYHAVSDLYRKYSQKLGIIKKTSHKARKTYISNLIEGNVNINTIREMVGHVDERTTLGNYCFDVCTEKERFQRIENALK